MRSKVRQRLSVMLVALVLGLAAYAPLKRALFAVRLLVSVRSLAAGATAEDLHVSQERVTRHREGRDLESLVYRPAGTQPDRALLLVAGISEQGCYHPRLMAVSRSLAAQGFVVVTPDIRMFREFMISPEALDEIAFWFHQIKELPGGDRIQRVGLGGISFSGTLALIAAARPEIRDRVAYVLAIGPYDDPLVCTRGWFGAGPITVGDGYYPTRFYAKWIIMVTALEMLPDPKEREFIHEVLVALLLQKKVPDPPPALSDDSRRWFRLAVMRENESDPELTRQIEAYLTPRLYRKITPDRAGPEIRCPVFLVHGAYDDLIPPDESRRLRSRLTRAKSYLLVSPFLTHTHPLDKPLGWGEQLKGLADIAGFFYRFAQVVAETEPNGPFCYC